MTDGQQPSGETSASSAQPGPRKRRPLRWVLRVGLVLLFVLIVVIIALPGILSGGWAKNRVTDIINHSIAGDASIDAISLSWFGQQRLEGLALRDPDGNLVASVTTVNIDASLWSLITGSRNVGTILVQGLEANYVAPAEGPSNLEKAVEPTRQPPTRSQPAPDAQPFRLPVAFRLAVDDARLNITQPDQPPMSVTLASLTLDASRPGQPIAYALDGAVQRGDHTGSLTGDGKLTGYQSDRTLRTADAQLDGNIKLVGLPVEAIDAIAQLDGLAVAAVDGPLDLTLTAAGPLDGEQTITLGGRAVNITAFELTGTLANDRLALKGDIGVVARPELVAWLNARSDQFNGRLVAGVPVTLTINRAATATTGFDPSATTLDARLTVQPGSLIGDEQIGDMSWQTITATVNTPTNLARGLRLELIETPLTVRGETGRIAANADLANLFDPAGEPTFEKLTVNGEAHVEGLPPALVDLIADLDGIAVAAIDGPIDLDATFKGAADGEQTFTLTADAANIESFQLDGTRDATGLRVTGGAKLTARPALLDALTRGDATFTGRLAAGVPLELTIAKLNTALTGFDPRTIAADLTLRFGEGKLVGDEQLSEFAWRPGRITFNTNDLAEGLAIALSETPITARGREGRLSAMANLTDVFDESGAFNRRNVAGEANLVAAGLPPALVDAMLGLGDWTQTAMAGVTLTADLKGSAADRIEAELVIADDADARRKLTLPLRLTAQHTTLKPDRKATLTFMPTDALLARLVPADLGYTVAADQPAELVIDRLDAPGLDAELGVLTPDRVRATGTLTLRGVRADPMADAAAGPSAPGRPAAPGPAAQANLGPPLLAQATGNAGNDPPGDTDTDPSAFTPADLGPIRIPELRLTLGGDSLAAPTLAGRTTVEAADDGLAATYAGRRIKLDLDAGATLDDDFAPTSAKLALTAANPTDADQPLESASIALQTVDGLDRARLTRPAVVKYRPTPAMLDAAEGQPTLARPTMTIVTIERLDTALAEFSLTTLKLAGRIAIDDAELAGDPQLTGARLGNLSGSFDIDGPADRLTAKLTGRLTPRDRAGTTARPADLTASVDLKQWAPSPQRPALVNASGEAMLRIEGLASRDAEAFADATGWIEPFVGERFDFGATVAIVPEAPTPFGLPIERVDLAVTSDKVSLEPRLRFTDEAMLLAEPATIALSVEPEVYQAVLKRADAPAALRRWALLNKVEATGKLTRLSVPLPLPSGDANTYELLKGIVAEARFTLPRLDMRDQLTGERSTYVNVTANLTTEDPTERLLITLKGKSTTTQPDVPDVEEDLDVDANLAQLWDPATGKLTRDQLEAMLETRLVALPVSVIDALLGMEGQMLAALGPRAALTADARLEKFTGPLNMTIDAAHAKVHLKGQVKRGVLYLREPLTAAVTVTPELGEKLLDQAHPLLRSVYTADKPITLTIDPGKDGQGFAVPLAGYDLADMRIDRATLDLGKLKAKPGPLLTGLKKLANQRTTGESSLWFSPLVFSIKNGRIAYDNRLDLLIDESFHIVTWGSVQLDTAAGDADNSRVALYFGFPRQTLDKVFGLDAATKNDLFTIPIRGRIDKPEIDFGAAAVDMGRLQAQYKLTDNPIARALIAKLTEKLLRPEGGRPPAASVDTLPWQERGALEAGEPDNAGEAGDDEAAGGGEAGNDEAANEAPDDRRRDPVRDALRDLFR